MTKDAETEPAATAPSTIPAGTSDRTTRSEEDAQGSIDVDSGKRPSGSTWKRVLGGIVAVAIVWWFIARSHQIEAAGRTLLKGQWQWLLLAAICQAAYFVLYSANYKQTFKAVGITVGVLELVPILLSSFVLGEVAPVGWADGSAVFVRSMTRRGNPASQALMATLFAQAADLLMFSGVFLMGILALALRHDMNTSETIGAIVLLTMNVGLISLLCLAVWKPDALARLWTFVQGVIAKIFRRSHPPQAAGRVLTDLTAAASAVRAQPMRLGLSLSAAGAANAIAVVSLWCVSRAFHENIGIGLLTACYGIGTLAWMISPVPASIGVVEGAITLVLSSVGIPAGSAAVIAISYRALSFWLPCLLGALALRRIGSQPAPKNTGA